MLKTHEQPAHALEAVQERWHAGAAVEPLGGIAGRLRSPVIVFCVDSSNAGAAHVKSLLICTALRQRDMHGRDSTSGLSLRAAPCSMLVQQHAVAWSRQPLAVLSLRNRFCRIHVA